MNAKAEPEKYSDDEAMRRMNEALKRALNMPHKPHKPLGKPRKAKAKPKPKR